MIQKKHFFKCQNLNRFATKECIWMADKPMKRFSQSLVIRNILSQHWYATTHLLQ